MNFRKILLSLSSLFAINANASQTVVRVSPLTENLQSFINSIYSQQSIVRISPLDTKPFKMAEEQNISSSEKLKNPEIRKLLQSSCKEHFLNVIANQIYGEISQEVSANTTYVCFRNVIYPVINDDVVINYTNTNVKDWINTITEIGIDQDYKFLLFGVVFENTLDNLYEDDAVYKYVLEAYKNLGYTNTEQLIKFFNFDITDNYSSQTNFIDNLLRLIEQD